MSTGQPTADSIRAATSAERLAAIVAHARRARERAEQMTRVAQAHQNRADVARRYAEQAADQLTRGCRDQ